MSPTGSETYQLFHVELADDVGQRWGVDIFDDLGTGTSYGAYAATAADEYTWIEIALNAVALADLNAAVGLFAFGGAVTTLDAEINDELLFGNSGRQNAYLVLETVPVPGVAAGFRCLDPLPPAPQGITEATKMQPRRISRGGNERDAA